MTCRMPTRRCRLRVLVLSHDLPPRQGVRCRPSSTRHAPRRSDQMFRCHRPNNRAPPIRRRRGWPAGRWGAPCVGRRCAGLRRAGRHWATSSPDQAAGRVSGRTHTGQPQSLTVAPSGRPQPSVIGRLSTDRYVTRRPDRRNARSAHRALPTRYGCVPLVGGGDHRPSGPRCGLPGRVWDRR
jgi:hypothetical protein